MNNWKSRIWNRITNTDKLAFSVAMVSGVLTHLYAMTNKLPTFDDLMCLNSFGGGVSLGRWFLEILGLTKHKLFGNYSTPTINGLLSVFFIAVASALLCRIIELNSKSAVVSVSVLLTVFPVMTGYMAFVYTAYYYCFAFVLMLVGAMIIRNRQNWKWGIAGCVFVALSIGIYQAYLPFFITLLLCILWSYSLSSANAVDILNTGLRYLSYIVISLAFYFIGSCAMQRLFHVSMSGMKGGNRIGSVLLDKGIGIIPFVYATYGELITGNYYGLTGKVWMQCAVVILYIITIVLFAFTVVHSMRENRKGVAMLQVIIALLLPLALHSLYAMVEKVYFYTLMLYVEVMIFVIPIMLLEHMTVQNLITKICGVACTICVIYSSCLYVIQDNATYLEMDLGINATKSYFTTLITQIKSLPDYNPEYPVLFVGDFEDSTLFDLHKEYFGDVEIGGTYGTVEAVKGMYLDLFLKQYCGFEQKVTCYEEMSNVDTMNCYPQKDSIRVLNETIVVKLSN